MVWRNIQVQALGATRGFYLPDLANSMNFCFNFYTMKYISAAHNLMICFELSALNKGGPSGLMRMQIVAIGWV